MIIRIKGQDVIFEDEKLTTLFLTTDQLIEMVRILNASINQDGRFLFSCLEFTV